MYNNICDLELIPDCFKPGIIVPAFKGKGKDPLLVNSYRGITLTSVFATVLENLLLNRMSNILDSLMKVTVSIPATMTLGKHSTRWNSASCWSS